MGQRFFQASEPLRAEPGGCARRWLLAVSVVAGSAVPAVAQDATWNLNPSANFNTAGNWTPATVPTGTAFFNFSNTTSLTFSANTTIGGWTFGAAAPNYDFTNTNRTLTFNGAGLVMNGGTVTIDNNRNVNFTNGSSAASADITNDRNLDFRDSSTAADATITNNRGLNFRNSSTAADATITNNRNVNFRDTSTAANATITNSLNLNFLNSSTAADATITNDRNLNFRDTSTAANATITNNLNMNFREAGTAADATITNERNLNFRDTSTAADATITNNRNISFFNTSTAGNATIANNGANGVITFRNGSNAGTATIDNDDTLNFRNTASAANATITSNLTLDFRQTSTAGAADITNSGNAFFRNTSTAGTATIDSTGTLDFRNSATVDEATITNDGDAIFRNLSTAGSATITNNSALSFRTTSTAGTAHIINNDTLDFRNRSTGGLARISTSAGAVSDFSDSNGPLNDDRLSAGSIAGAGSYFLGENELTVGGNDLSTEVSGVISDCGPTGVECRDSGATGGSLIKTGIGKLTLSGANTFTGPTTVTDGELVVNGSITSDVTVNGGVLSGAGQTGAVTNVGGIVAPGNSIGTMTVTGAFAMNAGTIFEVEVNAAGQGDKVIVNGTVNLTGSILRVLAVNGDYDPKTEYTIIDNDGADAVVGTFAEVTTNFAFLTPSVVYDGGDGNDVVLTLMRPVVPNPGGGGTSVLSFCSVADTQNQCNVAHALDKFPTDNPLFLSVLFQTAQGARQAFDALSGEVHATVAGTLADDSRYVREAVLGRLMQASHAGEALSAGGPQVASLDAGAMRLGGSSLDDGKSLIDEPESAPLAFWTSAFGAWGDFDTDGNAASADRNLGGFISGMDASIAGSWRAGLATGASFSNVSVDARYSSADVETYHLGGYLGGMAGRLALRGGGMWAWSDIETSRAVVFPRFYERQKASYDADTGQLFGEVAYPTQMGGIALEPFGGLAFVSVDTDSFRERGGPQASLRGVNTDQDVGYTSVGLRMATTMTLGGMHIVPNLCAAWLHAFDDVTPGASLAFATTGIGFAVDGVPLAEDSALLDAGIDFALGDRMSAGASYTGQFGDSVTDNGVKGRFTLLF